jgi:hypothetical protein
LNRCTAITFSRKALPPVFGSYVNDIPTLPFEHEHEHEYDHEYVYE